MKNSTKKFDTLSLSDKALGNLGLAARAGKLVTGDQLLVDIQRQSVTLVLVAHDASKRLKIQLQRKCKHYGIDLIESFTISELSHAIGKTNRVAVGITDDNFRRMLLK